MQPLLNVEEKESNNDPINEENLICDKEKHQSTDKFDCTDLYVIGNLWITTLKIALVGTNIPIIPTVHAAAKEEPPKKPPPMKYTDLPLYKCPHYEYKQYLEEKKKCPEANKKLLHNYLLPHVKNLRKQAQINYCQVDCALQNARSSIYCSIDESKYKLKKAMRDPDRLLIRKAIVAIGGLAGYLLAGKRAGIPRRLFYTGFGALSTGALCFPKETDEAFRSFAYYTSKLVIKAYNRMCGKEFTFRERVPCADELPPKPPERKSQCPKK